MKAVPLFVALFVALCVWRAGDHTHPYYDDVGFLDLGNQVRELGGPVKLVHALFDGRWVEDNRNPLYPAVLSVVAGRDPGYHGRAKALNIFIGVLAILSWWFVARRRFGERPALVLLAFLCASETMVDYSSRVASEPLLMVFWAWGLECILEGPRRWWLAGILAGLAQLAKGSGIFLVALLAVTLVAEHGTASDNILYKISRAVRDPWAWTMPAAFVVTGLPLFVRNQRVYGSPLHHWNNALLWMNRIPDYAEIYAPHALERIPHGPLAYLRQVTAHELIVNRLGLGIAEVAVHIGDAMSLVAPKPLGAWHIPGVVVGFTLFVVACRLLWKMERSFLRTFLLANTIFFVVFFVNFASVGGSSRYMIPMTIPLVAVLGAYATPRWLKAYAVFGVVCVVTSVALDPSPRKLPPGFAETQAWLVQHVKPGEGYAVDSRSHLEPEWLMPQGTHMEILSSAWQRQPVPARELLDELHARGVKYAVIDYSSNKDGQPRWLFYDGLPAGARKVFETPGWLIVQLD